MKKQVIKKLSCFVLLLLLCLLGTIWAYKTISSSVNCRKYYLKLNDEYTRVQEISPEGIVQHFRGDADREMFGARLDISTFGRNAAGTAHLELYNEDGTLLASSECSMSELLNDTFYDFIFEKSCRIGYKEPLQLKFWYEPAAEEDRLGLWVNDEADEHIYMTDLGQNCRLNSTAALQIVIDYSGTVVGFAALIFGILFSAAVLVVWILTGKGHPALAFAVGGLLIGVCMTMTLPPLCGPDEYVHFSGSYALANRLSGQPDYDESRNLYMRSCDASRMSDVTGDSGVYIYADTFRKLTEKGKDS